MINYQLLFDIDGTLFDTSKFKLIIGNKISVLVGDNRNLYEQITNDYFKNLSCSTDFYPQDYFTLLIDNLHINKQKIINIFENDFLAYKQSLYPEVAITLDKLSKKYSLGIFSEGYEDFQINKLINSGIINYFDKRYIYISRRKLKSIVNLPKQNTYIVDDKLQVLHNVKTQNTIWLNRKNKASSKHIPTIHKINELLFFNFKI